MSTTSTPTVGPADRHCWKTGSGHDARQSNWSAINILTMVVGFVIFWPLGLFMIYWIVTGRHASELPAASRRLWSRLSGLWSSGGFRFTGHDSVETSHNAVFDRFQQTQYDRISEIRDEINERARRFAEFRAQARERSDAEEFNQFMASSPERDTQ